jgi:hypothetical protein
MTRVEGVLRGVMADLSIPSAGTQEQENMQHVFPASHAADFWCCKSSCQVGVSLCLFCAHAAGETVAPQRPCQRCD